MLFEIDIICNIISDYLIDPNSTCYTMHKLMHILKEYKVFINEICKNFIKIQCKKYNIIDNNLYTLIQKCTKKKNIKHFPCYNIFLKNNEKKNNKFIINDLEAKHRQILYYLSIYYRYIWYTKDIEYYGTFGYSMYDKVIHDTEYNYKYLKSNRLYNPKYFEPINKNVNSLISIEPDTLFKLREDFQIYKQGVSVTIKTLIFEKI